MLFYYEKIKNSYIMKKERDIYVAYQYV